MYAYQLVAGDKNVERRVLVITNLFLAPELPESGAVLWVAPVRQRLQLGHETSNLLLPVMQC